MLQTKAQADYPADALENTFSRRLSEYGDWRDHLIADIQVYHTWLQQEKFTGPEDELRIYELLDSLRSDKLSLALVAEFSRGKTELINAIFFSDYKQRLLPSTTGRTTMCPTEIQYDEKLDPCIMLLPVETRKQAHTITEFKRNPVNWSTIPLNIESAKEMSEALREVARTKTVTAREARELGLYHPKDLQQDQMALATRKVEIPVWRHAIINYPHPLLKSGLVILDTPGLNALGSEPELTLSMLPNAHAVLFLLAADTGVTKTDLDMWKNHVCVATHGKNNGRLAVLNKIDTLWDELQSEKSVKATITRQVNETARVLGLNKENVFPVSAQKGLLGKVKHDPELLEKSGLARLEKKLSTDIIALKQELVRTKIVNEIGSMIESALSVIDVRLDEALNEYNELENMRGKSLEVLDGMSKRLREQKQIYTKAVESFEITRRMLSAQIKDLLRHMTMKSFDALIKESRQSMHGTWTTQGLRRGMGTFFNGAARRMEKVNRETKQIKTLIESIYSEFHKEHGLAKIKPASFSVLPYRSDFKRLEMDAEAFRNSPAMIMTEQHFVIKKFFITLVSRAHNIFHDCNRSTKSWSKAILTPIHTQIQEHKVMIDRRLDNLEKIRKNHTALDQRVKELKEIINELKNQQKTTRRMVESIYQPFSPSK